MDKNSWRFIRKELPTDAREEKILAKEIMVIKSAIFMEEVKRTDQRVDSRQKCFVKADVSDHEEGQSS